jgi:hypothetical protein
MEPHTHIGTTNTGNDVWLSRDERLEHVAVIGATGTGKSTLIEHLVAQDIARGDGVLLLGPNGPLAEAILQFVPPHRRNHVCYLNVPDLEWPVGFNVLEDVHPDRRAVLVDGLVSAMRSIWIDSWGPRMEQILRHAARALVEVPNAALVLLPASLWMTATAAVSFLASPIRSRAHSPTIGSNSGGMTIERSRLIPFSTMLRPSSPSPTFATSWAKAGARSHSPSLDREFQTYNRTSFSTLIAAPQSSAGQEAMRAR